MSRIKRKFPNDIYGQLAKVLTSDTRVASVETDGKSSCKFDIVLTSKKKNTIFCITDDQIYLFWIDYQKQKLRLEHICDTELFDKDVDQFIRNMYSEGLISDAAYGVLTSEISEDNYAMEMIKDTIYVARQAEQMQQDLLIMRAIDILKDSRHMDMVIQETMERVYEITKSMGVDLNEQE